MSGYYYDTKVFSYFVFKNDWEHRFSPTKVNGFKSLFCEEELLNLGIRNKLTEWGISSTLELWEKVLNVASLFKPYSLTLEEVQQHLYYIQTSIMQHKINLAEIMPEQDKKSRLDGMDWVHLSVADLIPCDSFITTDSAFENLAAMKDALPFQNLQKIILLEAQPPFKVVKEVLLRF